MKREVKRRVKTRPDRSATPAEAKKNLSPVPVSQRSSQVLAPLFALFALALAVRLLGLTWGLPNAGRWYSYHPDESTHQIVGAVAHILQGDWNPHFFNYPSLTIYATAFFYWILAALGQLTPASSEPYPWPFVRDILLAGRLFSAFLGAATAPVIYLLARELGLRRAAILAGILAALVPGHVQHSHFATVDVAATFFCVLCLFLSVRARDFKGLMWAALVAGLAAATKYNAILVLIAPLWSVWRLTNPGLPTMESRGSNDETPAFQRSNPGLSTIKPRPLDDQTPAFHRPKAGGAALKSWGKGAIFLVFLALAGFFLACPFALLAPHEFWGDGFRAGQNGFAYELFIHPREGSGEIFQNTGNGWWYHFSFNLPFVLTWPLEIAACLGLFFAFKERRWWPLLAFVTLYFFSLGFSQVRFMRYLLPLAPVLALAAAYAASRVKWRFLSAAVLAVFALVGSWNVLAPFLMEDPRDEAAHYFGKPVTLLHNPWFYTPPFQPQGFNQPIAGVKVTDGKVPSRWENVLIISEFEWRDRLRLNNEDALAPLILDGRYEYGLFKHPVAAALPGRDFVPQDYLYTNPDIRLFRFHP